MRTATSPQLQAFGRTVRKARRDRDLSQEALADEAGLSAKHIGEIERANKDPRLTTVLKIARALELQSSELLHAFEDRLRS
ncbi:MAG: helix-turn-helix domain-containing protein [Conexibacter sp.]